MTRNNSLRVPASRMRRTGHETSIVHLREPDIEQMLMLGIVTARDVARHVARGRLSSTRLEGEPQKIP